MIEIILRKDIQDYEARPLFGLTYRQAGTAALITAASASLGIGLASAGAPSTLTLVVVLAVGAAIGYVGLGTSHGLKPEEYYAIWSQDRAWPRTVTFSAPTLSPYSDRAAGRKPPEPSRRSRAAVRADCAAASVEGEVDFSSLVTPPARSRYEND